MIYIFLMILTLRPSAAHAAGAFALAKTNAGGLIRIYGIVGQSSVDAAKASALRTCSAGSPESTCEIKGTFTNRCYGVSLGDARTAWGSGYGDDIESARQQSLEMCAKYASSECRVMSSACDATPSEKIFTYPIYGNAVGVTILGAIEIGDDRLFLKAILPELRRGNFIYQVRIFSRGGNVNAAVKIGKLIRTLRASTIAPYKLSDGTRSCPINPYYGSDGKARSGSFSTRYYNDSDGGDPTCTCMSACSTIWLAGVGRYGDIVGVHRMAWDADFYRKFSLEEAQRLYDQAIREDDEYNREMGAPDWLTNFEMQFSSQQIQLLSSDQIQQFRNYPAYLDQMVIARCGGRTPGDDASDEEKTRHTDCRFGVAEENSKSGTKEILEKYKDQFLDATPSSTPEPAPTPTPVPTRPITPSPPPVVAPSAPAQPAQASYVRRDNRDLYSDDVDVLRDVDQDGCESACTANSRCEAYSYNKWKRACFLKSGLRNSRLEPASISATKNQTEFPPLVDVEATILIYRNRSFSGAGIGDKTMSSTEACANACSTSLSCVAFNFFSSQKICRFFNSQSDLPTQVMGVDSGRKSQPYSKD